MGLTHDYQAIMGTPGKGVLSGCDVTRTDANTVAMSAGQVRFGLTSGDIGAEKLYHNQVGVQKAVTAVSSYDIPDETPLGIHTIYLKTDGSLALTPEAGLAVTAGPMVSFSGNPTAMTFPTPSIALCTFEKTADLGTAASEDVVLGGTLLAGEIFRIFLDGEEFAYTLTNADVAGNAAADLVALGEGLTAKINTSALYTAEFDGTDTITITYYNTSTAGNDVTLTASETSASGTITPGDDSLSGAVLGGIKVNSIDYTRRETLV